MNVAQTDETKSFFYKMIGDYYRYVADCAKHDKLESVKNGALENYQLALTSSESLNPCNKLDLVSLSTSPCSTTR